MSGKTSLPRFSGRYSKWTKFEAAFRVGVHLKRIPKEEKLDKLLQCLSDGPKILLQQYDQLEAGTYKEAWTLLKDTYNNSHGASLEHSKDIFETFAVDKGDARGVRETVGVILAAVGKGKKLLQGKNGYSCAAAA